jgi:hypothetical protein
MECKAKKFFREFPTGAKEIFFSEGVRAIDMPAILFRSSY